MAKRKNAAVSAAAALMGKRRAKVLSPERQTEIAKQAVAARNEKLTPEERSAIAKKAGEAGGRGRKKKS